MNAIEKIKNVLSDGNANNTARTEAYKLLLGVEAELAALREVAEKAKAFSEAQNNFDERRDERNANVRLIAAAPELLEALDNAEKRLREEGHTVDADQARAAIAKAKPQ